MKYLLILASALVIFASGCKKDDDSTGLINLTASMTAKIDGESWKSFTRVTNLTKTGTLLGDQFNIIGTSAGGDIINITILGTEVGDYNFKLSVDSSAAARFTAFYKTSVVSANSENFIANSGTVSITAIDTQNKKISGTFSFSAIQTTLVGVAAITEGKFTNLKYTEISTQQ